MTDKVVASGDGKSAQHTQHVFVSREILSAPMNEIDVSFLFTATFLFVRNMFLIQKIYSYSYVQSSDSMILH